MGRVLASFRNACAAEEYALTVLKTLRAWGARRKQKATSIKDAPPSTSMRLISPSRTS
jgi:hypothetical protein